MTHNIPPQDADFLDALAEQIRFMNFGPITKGTEDEQTLKGMRAALNEAYGRGANAKRPEEDEMDGSELDLDDEPSCEDCGEMMQPGWIVGDQMLCPKCRAERYDTDRP